MSYRFYFCKTFFILQNFHQILSSSCFSSSFSFFIQKTTSFGTTIITTTTSKPSPLIPSLNDLVISASSLPPTPISLTQTTTFRSSIPSLSTAPISSDRRENQVNFVIDLFHQRVEQSQVSSGNNLNKNSNSGNGNGNNTSNNDAADLVSDALNKPGFDVIKGNHELDLGWR
ncbi:hypothetical protein V6Z11_A13G116600 [Gossypium hirsutum]